MVRRQCASNAGDSKIANDGCSRRSDCEVLEPVEEPVGVGGSVDQKRLEPYLRGGEIASARIEMTAHS